jgi:hypothetical protein
MDGLTLKGSPSLCPARGLVIGRMSSPLRDPTNAQRSSHNAYDPVKERSAPLGAHRPFCNVATVSSQLFGLLQDEIGPPTSHTKKSSVTVLLIKSNRPPNSSMQTDLSSNNPPRVPPIFQTLMACCKLKPILHLTVQ